MKSQIRFVMHADDEKEFAAQVLTDQAVCLIDGPRWKTPAPQTFRSLDNIKGGYCIIWSPADLPVLTAKYIATCNDWYCQSESATLQFWRSHTYDAILTEGQLAINTSPDDSGLSAEGQKQIESRFKSLRRFIKKHYVNHALAWCNPTLPLGPSGPGRSANPSKPDPQVWLGPHALQWLRQNPKRRVKQFDASLVEAALVQAVLSHSEGNE